MRTRSESVTRAWRGRLGLASPAHLLTATSGRPIKFCGVHIDRRGRVTIGTFASRRALDGFSAAGVCGSSWSPDSLESPRCTCVTCFTCSLHVLHVECVRERSLLSNVVDYPANRTSSDQRAQRPSAPPPVWGQRGLTCTAYRPSVPLALRHMGPCDSWKVEGWHAFSLSRESDPCSVWCRSM